MYKGGMETKSRNADNKITGSVYEKYGEYLKYQTVWVYSPLILR